MMIPILIVCYLVTIGILLYTVYYRTVKGPKESPDLDDFQSSLQILFDIVNLELSIYESDVFQNRKILTNNNFDNYYHEITDNIFKDIPDRLLTSLSTYYTEDALVKIIARMVKTYLVSKIEEGAI